MILMGVSRRDRSPRVGTVLRPRRLCAWSLGECGDWATMYGYNRIYAWVPMCTQHGKEGNDHG